MNLEDIVSLARILVHDPQGTGRDFAEWTAIVNLVYEDLIDEYPIITREVDLVLPATTRTVDLPSDCLVSIIPLVSINNQPLIYTPERELVVVTTYGTPFHYSLRGNTLVFDSAPIEDTTIKVKGCFKPTPLSAPSDTPEIPEEFHKAILYDAVATAFYADRQEVQGDRYAKKASYIKSRAQRAVNAANRPRRFMEDKEADDVRWY